MSAYKSIMEYESKIEDLKNIISEANSFINNFPRIEKISKQLNELRDDITLAKIQLFPLIQKYGISCTDSKEYNILQEKKNEYDKINKKLDCYNKTYNDILDNIINYVTFRKYYIHLLNEYFAGKIHSSRKMPDVKLKKLIGHTSAVIKKYKEFQSEYVSKHVRSIIVPTRKRIREGNCKM